MSDADSGSSDSDSLIWDFGSPNISTETRRKFVKTEESKQKKKKSKLWPSPHSIKAALDSSRKCIPESLPEVQNEPLETFRYHIKIFRERLDEIVRENASIVKEDVTGTKDIECSDMKSPPLKKLKANCDASILNDSIDDDSLSSCSQLVEVNNLSQGLGITSSSNKVVMSGVSEKNSVNTLNGQQHKANQPSLTATLLDDDEDFFLNESLLSY